MSIGQDWWRWDGTQWVALRTGTEVVVPTDPDDPDPDPGDPQTPDPEGRNVRLVTTTGGLSTGNQALYDILIADGWTVTVRAFDDPEDWTDVSVLVVSVGNPEGDSGRFVNAPVGVVAVDSWRPLGMGDGLGFATSPLTVEVVDPSSPLAAGYSGTFEAYQSSAWLTWKPETDSEQTVVTRAGQATNRVVFAYEAGTVMPHRYAKTRHVGLGYHADGFAAGLSAPAQAQFLAAVRWARDTTVEPVPVPDAPTGLSAAPGDSRVRLTWDPVAVADSYTPSRSTTTGGPYTALTPSVTTNTYTDLTAVNLTEYFYVVSATSASGTGPNSSEVSATPSESSSENLALLVSSDELAMWQDRSVNGPFRVAGDFSPNSPGHWSEMSSAMGLDFAAARWSGPTLLNDDSDPDNHPPGAVRRGQLSENMPPGPVRRMAHDMMSAAYAAMVTDNTSVAQAITNEIAYQATRPRLDFSNRTLWPTGYYNDINPLFMMAVWIKDYVLAYAVTKAMGFPSATVEKWFVDLAWLNEWYVHANMAARWPDRKSDSYVNRSSEVDTDMSWGSHRLADGTIIYFPLRMAMLSNRRNNQAGLFGLVGALLDDSYYIGEFKRYMREFVMFGCRLGPYGGFGDNNRGLNTFPQLGFSYALHGLESCLPAMDALARKGDTDLYQFSSSEGIDHPTWGTKYLKTMEECLDMHLKFISRDWPAQYTGSGNPPPTSVAGDPLYRVHSRNTVTNREIVNDANFLYAANYYNRSDWVDIIMRQGTPTGFTSTVQGVGALGAGWRTDWRNRFLRSLDANPYGGS